MMTIGADRGVVSISIARHSSMGMFPRRLLQVLTFPTPPHPTPQSVSRVLNITLPEHVLMKKMLARRVCADCGRGYNVADIQEGELVMPPLLPKPSDCERCVGKPRLVVREDDTAAVVAERMVVYKREAAPLIEHYTKTGKLQEFAVKRGMDDVPRLLKELGV